jgi:malate dehydrogenase (oxaloacetate-decarboxylating)(NADP+)
VEKDLREAALEYHRWPTPGKISVRPTKGLTNQRDLALAYSPGVAAACDAIVEDPATAAWYTSRANLVGVVTNGTAVLGLGNIGPSPPSQSWKARAACSRSLPVSTFLTSSWPRMTRTS